MNKQKIKGLLVVVTTLACAASALAQHPNTPDTDLFEIGKNRSYISEAKIPDKLSWAIISLINPYSKYRSVPLYGYPAAYLQDDEILGAILPSVAKGVVKVAIVTFSEKGRYDGQAVLFHGNENQLWDDTDIIEAWKTITSTEESGGKNMIAFSRPIRDHLFGDKEAPPVLELVASQELWPTDSSPR